MAEDLTVIVVALLGGAALDGCMRAVRSQCGNVLAVRRDGSIVDGEGRVLGMADRLDIPAKRRSGVELSATPLVALLEDTAVPSPQWAEAVIDPFRREDVVACGGPVRIADDLPSQTRALALSEYGRFAEGHQAGEAPALPGCNFAFRREALLKAMHGSDGLVDLPVFDRMREHGGKLVWAPDMAVTYSQAYPEGARLTTRFGHGRIYGSSMRGLNTAAKALALPAVLTARTLKQTGPANLPTLAWLMLQHTAWAAGEFTGAVFGESQRGLGQWR